ncbi:LysR family transcriptional regulator [Thaumasiovibrio subtropicus]|uniref:LysR family transcriptional regulator n=1 Tax=Thaumasiovibrio subtropicus TaxID=1891207 RepID=UPI000B35147A|nr:LysR family transcriptional regulator [Thaumasiovibrio subtropicus]
MSPYPSLPHSHNGLKVFESVARLLSFTLAAEELNVTQSAVSRQIKQLENELQSPLITRHHRAIALTEKGETLSRLLSEHYQGLESTFEQWRSHTDNRIIIKAAMSFAIRWLIPRLHDLNANYPDHEIVIVPTLDEDVAQGKADYDLLVFNSRQPDQYTKRNDVYFLRREFMAPVCARASLGDSPDEAAILAMPRLHSTVDHHDWKAWLADKEEAALSPVKNTTFATLDMALSAALSGQGATVTDLLLVLPELEEHFLYCPSQTHIKPSAWDYFCYLPNDKPIVSEVVNWIRQQTAADIKQLNRLSARYHWQLP